MRFFLENEIEDVYNLMMGIAEPTSRIPSLVSAMKSIVKNAMEGECAELDEKIFLLREKIAKRLGTDIYSDKDLIELANLYESVQKILCKNSFLYSRLLLQDEKKLKHMNPDAKFEKEPC